MFICVYIYAYIYIYICVFIYISNVCIFGFVQPCEMRKLVGAFAQLLPKNSTGTEILLDNHTESGTFSFYGVGIMGQFLYADCGVDDISFIRIVEFATFSVYRIGDYASFSLNGLGIVGHFLCTDSGFATRGVDFFRMIVVSTTHREI